MQTGGGGFRPLQHFLSVSTPLHISRSTVALVASAAVVGCVQNGISLLHTV